MNIYSVYVVTSTQCITIAMIPRRIYVVVDRLIVVRFENIAHLLGQLKRKHIVLDAAVAGKLVDSDFVRLVQDSSDILRTT